MDKRELALYLGFILIIVAAFSLRLYHLDERVFHHDEAAVGYFTYKLFNDGTYSYDPSFHGPFMYYVTAEMYRRMGDNIYSSRLLPAIFGASMLFLLFPLRKYIGNMGMVLAAFFFAVSPSFLYYSRFYREDIFIAFFTLLALVCAVKYAEKYTESGYSYLRVFYLFLAGAALVSLAALKENAYIMMALIAFFLLLLFIRQNGYKGLPGRIKSRDKQLFIPVAEGLFLIFVVLVLFSLFYTGNVFDFSGMKVAVEKAISHWYEMHKIQRIGGPYYFYLPIIALYELPVLIFGVLGAAYYGYCDKKKEKMFTIFLAYWVIVDIMYILTNYYPASGRFLPTSYIPAAFVIYLPLLVFGILTVLKSRNLFYSFLIYWTVTNLVVYSYVQEKVPWLVLNPLLPLVILAAAYLGERLPGLKLNSGAGAVTLIALILSLTFFMYSSVFLNYYDYTNPAEPLIQAAQPPQKYSRFLDTFFEISSQYQNQSTEVQVTDDQMETQFLWYLRHYGNVKWKVSVDSSFTAPLIVVHDPDGNESEVSIVQRRLSSDYMRLDSAKMSWYWFKDSDINLGYLLYRKMDRPPGEYRFVLFYKPKN
ncbi:Dolichyl-phosphate-mannose-protein mannosyltransferase [uncultured archaeon]|nr:Dolichyl-phosphate-mannose-protein mannosyltransferase [uncultured archaeon]